MWRGVGVVLLAALVGCAPPQAVGPGGAPATIAQRAAADQRQGDQAHQQILAKFGGAYQNARLASYVTGIGQRIAAVSEQPNARWTFTVLDSPDINAFAVPGGYVYVTRGLVALAGDEAELAGVIGHEIGHVTAGHSALRQERAGVATLGLALGQIGLAALGVDPGLASGISQVGQLAATGALAQYSQADELNADNLGVRYLARAGYDPFAQADFLDRMGAAATLEARLSGQASGGSNFFASHPTTGARVRQAIDVATAAGAVGTKGADRARGRFLEAIDGMAYGEAVAQGVVEGRRFSHPALGFTYAVPEGFRIDNQAQAVIAVGPRGARQILEGARDPGGRLTDYIAGTWAPGIARSTRVGTLGNLGAGSLGGLEAARAILPVELNGTAYDALLVAIRLDGTIYRLTGLAPRNSGLLPALERSAQSFARLSRAEAAAFQPRRLEVVTVRPGDTVARLAARMAVDQAAEARFRLLNGLGPQAEVAAGQRVKLVQ